MNYNLYIDIRFGKESSPVRYAMCSQFAEKKENHLTKLAITLSIKEICTFLCNMFICW
jgi:hypothetical protein